MTNNNMALIYDHFAGRNGISNGSRPSSAPYAREIALFNLDGTLLRIDPVGDCTSVDAYVDSRESGLRALRNQGNTEANWLYETILTNGLKTRHLVARAIPGAQATIGSLRGQGLEIVVFSTSMADAITLALDQAGLRPDGRYSTWDLPLSTRHVKTTDSFRLVNAMLGGTTRLYVDDSVYVLSQAARQGFGTRQPDPEQAVRLYHFRSNGERQATHDGIVPIRHLSEIMEKYNHDRT